MKIGFIGLGKLGFPSAVTFQAKGHDVQGFDVNSGLMNNDQRHFIEAGPGGLDDPYDFNKWLKENPIRFGTMQEVLDENEIIFLAVQTPNDPEFEGIDRLPLEREDFDYSFLITCLEDIADKARKDIVVAIISTVLPGTFNRRLRSIIAKNPRIRYCYNPAFIAMGTVMHDLVNPEFVLLGGGDSIVLQKMKEFYRTISSSHIFTTNIENAEVIKVLYNTYIGMKIVFANTNMELCEKLPFCDADIVIDALSLADRRLMSPAYLRGGMGDGGGCHPRDNIALSWLGRTLNLSFDWFGDIMLARERQTEWLVNLMCSYSSELPRTILGYSFKAESNITTGSPALLLNNLLYEKGIIADLYDPLIDKDPTLLEKFEKRERGVFFIGTKHNIFKAFRFPYGSIVIDPWRFLNHLKDEDVTYVPIGRG